MYRIQLHVHVQWPYWIFNTFTQRHQHTHTHRIITMVNFNFRILGETNILDLFTIDKHTGQVFIKDTAALDVNHLKSENIYFSVEVRGMKHFQFHFKWLRKHWLNNFTMRTKIGKSVARKAHVFVHVPKLVGVKSLFKPDEIWFFDISSNGINFQSILYSGNFHRKIPFYLPHHMTSRVDQYAHRAFCFNTFTMPRFR